MATSTSAHPYPSRPYTGLGRPANTMNTFAPQQQTPYAAPPQPQLQSQSQPHFGAGAGGNAAGAQTAQQREAQRLERERLERAERERREAEERDVLGALSEEQREEIMEAVSYDRSLLQSIHVDRGSATWHSTAA